MMIFVRWILPTAICIAGLIAIALKPDNAEAGMMIVGAGLSVWLLNFLYRLSVSGDKERDQEDQAREYFDRHGRWPDEDPRSSS
jgi:hypothetical protein